MVTNENTIISKVTFSIKKISFTKIYATKIAIAHDIIFFIFKPFNIVSKTSVNKRKTHKLSVISVQI